MLSAFCPQCSYKIKAPDGLAGKKAKCGKCGHVFVVVAEPIIPDLRSAPPQPPPLPKRAASKHEADSGPAAIEAAKPTRGNIVCPYCSTLVAENVLYAGQTIICPACHGSLSAPGGMSRSDWLKMDVEYAQSKVLIQGCGFVATLVLFFALMRGCF